MESSRKVESDSLLPSFRTTLSSHGGGDGLYGSRDVRPTPTPKESGSPSDNSRSVERLPGPTSYLLNHREPGVRREEGSTTEGGSGTQGVLRGRPPERRPPPTLKRSVDSTTILSYTGTLLHVVQVPLRRSDEGKLFRDGQRYP